MDLSTLLVVCSGAVVVGILALQAGWGTLTGTVVDRQPDLTRRDTPGSATAPASRGGEAGAVAPGGLTAAARIQPRNCAEFRGPARVRQ